MALPKIQHTLYEHTLVGSGKKVKFRPFTNAEQKTLLLAKESKGSDNNQKEIISAISEIIKSCTLGKVEGDKLSTFDLEDLFVRIRAKSVGEIINTKYRYDYTDDEGKKQSKFIDVPINVDDIKIKIPEDHDKKIMLTESLGIMMKYPSLSMLETVDQNDDNSLAMACFDYIFDGDEIYNVSDVSKKELEEFYGDIDTAGMLKIQKFFKTIPRLEHTVKVKISDELSEEVTFSGMTDFFI